MKTTLFSSTAGDVLANLAFTNNFAATVDPGVTNDSSAGYQVGSVWINTTAKRAFSCVDATAGAAVWNETGSSGTAGQVLAPDASTATGTGGAALLKGGAGGTTSGDGGAVDLTGGAATAGNGNGGDVVLTAGAKNGTGANGNIVERSLVLVHQGSPGALTTSGVLTAAQLLLGILTVNQGGGATSAQQLPLATALDTALPNSISGDAFDFSMINVSTVDAEDASITTNTGWTLVGNMDVPAYSAAGSLNSSGIFRARKTGTGAWTLYRLG